MHEPNPIPPPVVLTPCIATQTRRSSPFLRRSSPSRDVLSSSSLPLRRPCRRHPGPVARRRLSQPTPRVLRAVQTRSHLCASPLRSCASLFSVSPPSLMTRHGCLKAFSFGCADEMASARSETDGRVRGRACFVLMHNTHRRPVSVWHRRHGQVRVRARAEPDG